MSVRPSVADAWQYVVLTYLKKIFVTFGETPKLYLKTIDFNGKFNLKNFNVIFANRAFSHIHIDMKGNFALFYGQSVLDSLNIFSNLKSPGKLSLESRFQ